MTYHNPVLLHTCIDGLNIRPNGTYVDVTFGGGGHSTAILEKLDTGRLIAFDQDKDAQANALADKRFTLIPKNFNNLKSSLNEIGITSVDGVLADLGVSSHQFDEASRGFSIRFEADLDMRMDQSQHLTAAGILNNYSEEDLKEVFKQYGELDGSYKLARTIFSERKKMPIQTVDQLKALIRPFVPKQKENQYLAQLFQALRIEVNDELNALKELLLQTCELLNQGGRMVIISYHSLEDRLVKNFIRSGKFEGDIEKDFYGNPIVPMKAINNKPIVPDEEEIKINNRARSAKLRIAEKL